MRIRFLIFSLLLLAAVFGLAETIQRVRHPTVGFRHMTNSLGYRSLEFDPVKPEGALRILFAGESTTFGVSGPVEETLPFRTGDLLKRRFPEKKIESLNIAWPGKTSYGVLERIREALYLKPDILIVMTGYNDSASVYRDFADIRGRGDLFLMPWYFRIHYFLAHHSVLYVTLREKISVLVHGTPGFAFSSGRPPEQDQKSVDEWLAYYPSHFRKNLEAMIELSRREGFKLIFIRPPLSPSRREGHPLYTQAFDRLMLELENTALVQKVPLIDLSGFYRSPESNRWVGRDGLHFTAEGNQKIAEAVTAFLIEGSLIG